MVPAKPFSAPPVSPPRPMDAISPIAGTLLPIERAEELLQTLPGVLNVRIVSGQTGEVSEVHILTTTEVSPKQTVRNVESALLAHLGMRVSHKKISVATSEGPAAEAFRAARMATPPLGHSRRAAAGRGARDRRRARVAASTSRTSRSVARARAA